MLLFTFLESNTYVQIFGAMLKMFLGYMVCTLILKIRNPSGLNIFSLDGLRDNKCTEHAKYQINFFHVELP